MRFRSVASVLTLAFAASACGSSSKHTAPSTTPTRSATTATTAPSVQSLPTGSLPAATIVREARSNAVQQGWAHIDLQFHMSAKALVFNQDSGPDIGRQVVTIGTEHATVLLIDHVAYVNANKGALGDYFGLGPSSATLAGKWIAIKPSDTAYATVSAGITLADALTQIAIGPPFGKPTAATIRNRHAIGISGMVPTSRGAPEPATLYVPASGEILPFAFDFSDPGTTDRAVFGAWGKKVQLTAPKNPVAFSSYVSGKV